MRNKWKCGSHAQLLAILVAGVLIGMTATLADAALQREQATLTVVVGSVEVSMPGSTTWSRATIGMKLPQGAQIRAGDRSEAEFNMTDGSIIKVTANTRLAIRELTADPATKTRTSFFHLVGGRIRYLVTKAATTLVAGRQSSFSISTPTAVAAVRGCDGIVAHNPGTGISSFGEFHPGAAVFVSSLGPGARMVVAGQGQATQVVPGQAPTIPAPMPSNMQATILNNAPIRTQSPPTNPPTLAPVPAIALASPPVPVTGVPGAPPPGVPPAAPPPPGAGASAASGLIPSTPPPGAPPPPSNQMPQIPTNIVLAPSAPPPTPADVQALTSTAPPPPPPPAAVMQNVTTTVPPPAVVTPPPVTATAPPPAPVPPPPVMTTVPPVTTPPLIVAPPVPPTPPVTNPANPGANPPPPSPS